MLKYLQINILILSPDPDDWLPFTFTTVSCKSGPEGPWRPRDPLLGWWLSGPFSLSCLRCSSHAPNSFSSSFFASPVSLRKLRGVRRKPPGMPAPRPPTPHPVPAGPAAHEPRPPSLGRPSTRTRSLVYAAFQRFSHLSQNRFFALFPFILKVWRSMELFEKSSLYSLSPGLLRYL